MRLCDVYCDLRLDEFASVALLKLAGQRIGVLPAAITEPMSGIEICPSGRTCTWTSRLVSVWLRMSMRSLSATEMRYARAVGRCVMLKRISSSSPICRS